MRGADLALPIFSFNDPAPAALDTLSLHDALPISDSPVPKEVYPSLAWDSLFENRGNIRNKSILDRVMGDAQSLSGKISSSDKSKLEEYLTSVREVERRVDGMRQSKEKADELAKQKNK